MRLIYIADSIIPSKAANSVQVMQMCAAFAELGHNVTLVVRSLPELEIGGVDPFPFYGVATEFHLEKLEMPPFLRKKAMFGLRAAWWARRRLPELLFSRSLSACCFSALFGLDVIYESHTPERGWGLRLYPWLRRSGRLRKHVVITEALKKYYTDEHNVPAEEIWVAPSGAAPPHVTNAARLGASGRCQVGYVGHLYAGRGVELIVDLARRVPEADFHLLGGNDEDVAAWKVRAGGIPNVRFHGFLPPVKVDDYRTAFDVVLAPYQRKVSIAGGRGHDTSRWMSPLKLLEYMAAGKPILASRLDVMHELLEDGRTALLSDPEDVEEWERNLRLLIQSPELRSKLGSEARREFESRYTWRQRAEAILREAGFSDQTTHRGLQGSRTRE